MDPWTAEDRNEYIKYVVNSNEMRGNNGPYQFFSYPKNEGSKDQEDPKRAMITECLATTVFKTNPIFRKLSLSFYNILVQKLSMNSFTGPYMGNDIIVLLKGGSAYPYVTAEAFPEDFKFADLDIVVYINPNMPSWRFDELALAVKVTVIQTMSQYKRLLDHMLFLNKPIEGKFLDDQDIQMFKETYSKQLADIPLPDDCEFVSPFESDADRNFCSRNSFIITKNLKRTDMVNVIEVPHYDRCERIPLRKTPVYCSYNETLDFKRDVDATFDAHFDLYRVRFNAAKYVEKDSNGDIRKEERVTADFIDISIAHQNDSELIDFWQKGRCLTVYDRYANIWLVVPDIQSCISDLHKMLNLYECPESKRPKRLAKYTKLQNIMVNMYQMAMSQAQIAMSMSNMSLY